MARDCPGKETRAVQLVQTEEPEVLFIGHTEVVEKEPWRMIKGKRSCRARKCDHPPGLEMPQWPGFKVLQEDEDDEDDGENEARQCYINAVEDGVDDVKALNIKKGGWACLGVGDITVDSAADESCWPKELGDAFPTKPSGKNIVLKTANGEEMGHYGEKDITFKNGDGGDLVGLKFQVTDVRKPLLAVKRLVENGNVVSFGPKPDRNYILNIASGRRIDMEKKKGSFVIKAHFVKEVTGGSEEEAGFTRQVR